MKFNILILILFSFQINANEYSDFKKEISNISNYSIDVLCFTLVTPFAELAKEEGNMKLAEELKSISNKLYKNLKKKYPSQELLIYDAAQIRLLKDQYFQKMSEKLPNAGPKMATMNLARECNIENLF
jgi:hypothetical protein